MQLLFQTFFDITYSFDNIRSKPNRPLQLVEVVLPLNMQLGTYTKIRVSYFELLYNIFKAHPNRREIVCVSFPLLNKGIVNIVSGANN